MYGEGVRGVGREPGFRVVKKNQDSEKAAEEPVTDINVKEWEVGNVLVFFNVAVLYCLYVFCMAWIRNSSLLKMNTREFLNNFNNIIYTCPHAPSGMNI